MTSTTNVATPVDVFSIQPVVSEFRAASTWLATTAAAHGVPTERIERLDLCLNEALANVVSYGGDAATASPLHLSLQLTKAPAEGANTAAVSLSDAGSPFDPTTAEIKARPVALETAELGGHGLVILRSLADFLSYDYVDGRNTITFGVRWTDKR